MMTRRRDAWPRENVSSCSSSASPGLASTPPTVATLACRLRTVAHRAAKIAPRESMVRGSGAPQHREDRAALRREQGSEISSMRSAPPYRARGRWPFRHHRRSCAGKVSLARRARRRPAHRRRRSVRCVARLVLVSGSMAFFVTTTVAVVPARCLSYDELAVVQLVVVGDQFSSIRSAPRSSTTRTRDSGDRPTARNRISARGSASL